jgi:hypothetical protein
MPIEFECPSCLRDLTFDDTQAGTPVTCPNPKCRAEFTLPDPAEADAPYGLGVEVVCPGCGKGMAPDAVLCIECGYDSRTGRSHRRRVEEKDVVEKVDGTRYHFNRDRDGRWTLALQGRVLGMKTKDREFQLRRYSAVVAEYEHDGWDDNEGDVTVSLQAPDGAREQIYFGDNWDFVKWLEGVFRDQVGMRFRTERA